MAPTVGSIHLLVAKNVKILRLAVQAASKYAKGKLPAIPVAESALQPTYAYAYASKQPVHPAAFLKQTRRWISSRAKIPDSIRHFGTTAAETHAKGPSYASSRIGLVISQSSGRAPFASTLRPKLTGGALPRSSGGYGLGSGRIGGRRYFSHTPEAPAQVITNVSQAMRAFMLNGQKIHFDGTDPRTGEKRFKSVSPLQDKATKKMTTVPRATPGSFLDFNVNPTITAMAPMAASIAGYVPARNSMDTLNTEGLLDILSVDFSRVLRELALVMKDLRSLSSLGDLPISYQGHILRVHFPGVDPETVESIARELNIKRGMVGQDAEFDAFVGTEIALLFPFAPSETSSTSSLFGIMQHNQVLPPEEDDSFSRTTLSDTGLAYDDMDDFSEPSESFETVASRSLAFASSPGSRSIGRGEATPFEYQDFEGIYRFIELCDNARR